MHSQQDTELSPEAAALARATLEALATAISTPADQPVACPICKKIATSRKQIGRCVYMDPCGCHYQGKL